MGFWSSEHNPNVDAEKNNFNMRRDAYDLDAEQYERAGVGTHLKRAVQSVMPKKMEKLNAKLPQRMQMDILNGAGRAGQYASNIAGRVTSHQLKTSPMGSRFMNQFLGSGFMAYGLMHGDSAQDVAGYTLPMLAASLAYSPTREVGMAVGKLGRVVHTGFGNTLGKVIGRTGGTLAALTAATTAYVGSQMFDSNNFVKESAAKVEKGMYVSKSGSSNSSMTHRQKMLNKLSKSGLNDRGTLLRE